MPNYKYICLDCGYQFDEPRKYTETHGLDSPPYEHMSCCPVCGGSYDEAVKCLDCGDIVPMCEAVPMFEDQELLNGGWLCENCYTADQAAQQLFDDRGGRAWSMTREEAIKLLKQYQGYEPISSDGETLRHAFDLTDETVDTLLTALHPVSREQVEKIRGEWMFPIFGDQQDANDPRCQCSKCGSIETPLARHRFCPNCGAPMTDEAVDMMLKRMEEIYK